MKNVNVKKIVFVILTGFVLVTTGCTNKKEIENNEPKNDIIEITDYVDKSEEIKNKDEYVINYFEEKESEVNEILENNSFDKLKEGSKEIFVNLVDFLFYNGEIKGITFDELNETTKTKILNITSSIDSKIEKKIPDYKETTKDKTGKVLIYVEEKIKSTKEFLEEKVIEKVGEDKYKETVDEVKEKGNEIKEKSKEIIDNGKTKIKNWYEGWK
ncbi:MAG: hypothetical protein RSB77_00080 [Bacilli bacterium]